jgi:hypothetical protein
MSSDNQLCTVLLLVALGFLINYLCKPKKVNDECFADVLNSTDNTTPPNSNNNLPPTQLDTSVTQQTPPPSIQSAIQLLPSTIQSALQSVQESPVVQAVIKSLPVAVQSNMQPVAPSIKSVDPTVDAAQMDVFKFSGNDIYLEGADLDSAFTRPISEKAALDAVDLNKNNLTKYDAKDFLPKEINDDWFDTDFSQAKFNINDDKLINTERYVIGVNTVGQSLKNASYDIRGTVPNPKFTVSPWNNSTYETDFNLKPLC